MLSNLVSNALKFTTRGGVRVRVDRIDAAASETATRLRFEVQDSGIGLAREEIRRLFRPFQQADNSTTRRYGGSGLGLSISKRLVELMGGEIGVESQPGQGSRFWFTVQLQEDNAGPLAAAAPWGWKRCPVGQPRW